jgi:hypothetical protein
MAKIINILMVLIAYVCVATVIALALGVGYLWHSEQLNDEKLFRIMALWHDIDLHQISEEHRKRSDEVPPEEPSLDEVSHREQVLDRNHEVKLLALQVGRQEYQHWFQQLKEQADRNHRQAQELQDKLKQQEVLTTQENIAKVVGQIEQLRPDVAKESLMRWIDEGRMDDAILLMNRMSDTRLSKILKSFETAEELDKLHEIHERILASGGGSPRLQKTLNNLESVPATN